MKRAITVVLALAGTSQTGCVQRRFTIRSNPPGARVYVDDYEVGTTPCSTDFIYYGTRKVRLVKPGYETLTVLQPVPTPWYQYPPLDFISENLVPGETRDERVLDYQLTPQVVVPAEQLLSRAESLRQSTQQAQFAPPPGVLPPPAEGVLPPPAAGPNLAPPAAPLPQQPRPFTPPPY
jgi:hypothetical protein